MWFSWNSVLTVGVIVPSAIGQVCTSD
jgi:hypothetical protein